MIRPSAFRFDVRSAIALLAASVAFAVTSFAPQVLNDGDTFLHVAAGSRMLAEHAILFADPFSYTLAGAPWDAHEWLAEIAMALAWRAGGWSGLVVLFAVAAALTAGLLAFRLGRWLTPPAQALVTLLALSCMTSSLLARPHLLALPLLLVWAAELVAARSENRRPSFWLLPVMIVWVNIHASFLLGLLLAAGLGLEAVLASPGARTQAVRGWGLFGAAALCAALVNPHLVQGLVFPLQLMGTKSLGNVGEWQAVDFTRLQPIEFVVAAALYVLVSRKVKVPLVRAALLLGLLIMAIAHSRHQIVFAVVAPLLLAEPLSQAFGNGRSRGGTRLATAMASAALLAMMGLAALRLTLPLNRGDGAVSPVTALAAVPSAMRLAPVLNDYSFGGYLIFAGVRPFIDSRAELYGEASLERYAALIRPDPATLDAVIRRYGIRWAILTPRSPMVAELDHRPGWRRLYADDYAVVQIRDNVAP